MSTTITTFTQHAEYSRGWLIARSNEASATLEELRRVLPGCFNPDGSPRVASAHLPRLPHIEVEKK